jgi:hypothetical protein
VLLLFLAFGILGFIAASGQAGAARASIDANASLTAALEGLVLDHDSRRPLPGASIHLLEYGLTTTSDPNGRYAWYDLPLSDPSMPITIEISAPGYGPWRMQGVQLWAADVLRLTSYLKTEPVTIFVPPGPPDRSDVEAKSLASLQSLAPMLDQTSKPLPETIRVRITDSVYCDTDAEYTVEVVDFHEYVRNVLPNEWITSWPRESLRAGAMAVKMYAWQIVASGGRYEDADVWDSTCDQVYIPGVAYASTDRAIAYTWNWRLTHEDASLFRTHYLDWYWRCEEYGWQGYCMGQWDTYYHALGNNGYEKLVWDEMLFRYYWDSQLSYIPPLPPAQFALRFYGNGWGDIDRVKIRLQDSNGTGLPVDMGDADFTLEWWMKALAEENDSPECVPGGDNWMNGNVILDRDVLGPGDHGEYGVSLAGGRIAFGLNNGTQGDTLCGNAMVADGRWRHIAITRRASDGLVRIFVDGALDFEGLSPTGDLSYRDGRTTSEPDQDPYLVLGARKSDSGEAYSGWMDELRLSSVIRYDGPFSPPAAPFAADAATLALYHFNEGHGNLIGDSSGASGGPSDGMRNYGGDPSNGPEWFVSDLFLEERTYLPIIRR